jgi:hypothetical protein
MGVELVGQKHWQSPDQLRIKKEPGFGYRYIKKLDVERRVDEGWEIVASPLRAHREGGPVEKAQFYRGLILMRMPKEMVDQRNAHYSNLHKRRLRAVAHGAHMTSVLNARTSEGSETEDGRPLAGAIGRGLVVHQGVHTNAGLTHTDNIEIPVATHPDDLREDMKVAEEMAADKSATENGEGDKPAKAISTRSKPKHRR